MRRVVLSLIVAVTGFAQVPGTDGTQRYIVRLKDSAFARHDAEALPGFRKIHRGQHIPTVTVSATPQELKQLQAHPDVAYVTPDRPLRASSDLLAQTINATANGSAQGVWQFGANGFSGNLGQGVTVAVIDSGIDNSSQDFGNAQGRLDGNNSRILYRENSLVPAQSNGQYPPQRYQTNDAYGHGTHVAGLIAGNGFVSSQPGSIQLLAGIAPAANLIDLQVLDQTGQGTDSNVIAAIDRAISLQQQYHIRVINLSLGRPVYQSFSQDPLDLAVEQAWAAGIVVVTAAGNDGRDNTYGENGYETINAPGNDPLAITVGAMRTAGTPQRNDDEIASYSSRGPTAVDHIVKPDLVAPGNLVSSVLSSLQGGGNSLAYLPATYPQDIVNNLA